MICSSSSGRSFFFVQHHHSRRALLFWVLQPHFFVVPTESPSQQSTNTAKRNPYKRDDLRLWSVFVLKFESAPIHRGGETCFELGYGGQVEL